MGPEPDQVADIRRQIDESRRHLGSAVGALAYKADIKNRGKEALHDKKEQLMEKVDELKARLPGNSDGEGGGMGEAIKAKLPDAGAIKDKLPDADAVKAKLPDADAIRDKLPDGVGDAAGRIADAAPSKEDVRQKAQDAAGFAHDHPVAVTAGAAAAGLVAGLALPATELEREKLAPTAQQVRHDVQDRVAQTVEQVKHGAKDAVESVTDAIKQTGEQHAGKLGDIAANAAEKTQDKLDG